MSSSPQAQAGFRRVRALSGGNSHNYDARKTGHLPVGIKFYPGCSQNYTHTFITKLHSHKFKITKLGQKIFEFVFHFCIFNFRILILDL